MIPAFLSRRRLVLLSVPFMVSAFLLVAAGDDTAPAAKPTAKGTEQAAAPIPAPSPAEARERARLLHETLHATLQFVHDEYYRPDERLPLPAVTLERVFDELARQRKVTVRWLAVNAKAMNVEHQPRDDFEQAAVAALTAGQDEFERVEKDVYRHAGTITLSSDCLKCHLPARTSTKARAAALVISIPLLPQ